MQFEHERYKSFSNTNIKLVAGSNSNFRKSLIIILRLQIYQILLKLQSNSRPHLQNPYICQVKSVEVKRHFQIILYWWLKLLITYIANHSNKNKNWFHFCNNLMEKFKIYDEIPSTLVDQLFETIQQEFSLNNEKCCHECFTALC